jgi:hypothetical protein
VLGTPPAGRLPRGAICLVGPRPVGPPREIPTEEVQQHERDLLFRIIEQIVKWKNSKCERILNVLWSRAGLWHYQRNAQLPQARNEEPSRY